MAMVRYSTSRRHALAQARRLIGCYPHSRPPDVLQYANALADVLEQYPIGVVEECCDPRSGIARVREFPPTVACLVEWCDRKLAAYRAVASRPLPRPEISYSEEHCATMRQRLQDLMRGLLRGSQTEATE